MPRHRKTRNVLPQTEEESRHIGSSEGQQVATPESSEEEADARATGNQTEHKKTKKRPSVKRDRDYSTHITWTYDLNKDLYKCYKDADKSIYGHATRMKDLWDKRHPTLAHLTSKHLTTQATRVIKKKLIPEVTEDDITCNKTDQNDDQICERLEPHNQTTEDIPQNIEHLEVDNQTIETSENIPLPALEPVTVSDELMEMIKMIKPDWKKLRDKKIIAERQRINTLFNINTKSVFREFRKDKKIDVTEPPPKEAVKQFWNDIWSKEGQFNSEAKWVTELRKGYCQNVRPTVQRIKLEHFNKINNNLKDGNSPGRDLIVGYWIKKNISLRQPTFDIYQNINNNNYNLPEWLVKTRTTLLPKNGQTHDPKNYRPIACENLMMKVYTGCIASLLEEHCTENNIIYPEQAGAKKGMWGCTDQLLINKVVADEVRNHRRNLCTIWLDYKKAYDSVPFQWILEALRLAKVPEAIVESIQTLMKSWVVELNLPTKEGNIQIGEILYRKGLLQGDYLSVILFILSLNPVSYLLNQADGYKMGDSEKRDKNLTHLLFVDDMKLYANSRAKALYLLDIVTTFSRDIGMAFGEDKCGYIYIEKGKRKAVGKSMVSNDVTIKELKEGELYKYLGLDENIQYDGSINKGKILKEYFRRVKAIWSSELNSRNKTIAHNTFALPILVPTAGILEWTLQEIEEVDKKTRKLLCMSGNFHRNSDVDRLYVKRKDGGRGLKSFEDSFINRIIGLARHLERDRTKNHLLQNVYDHEQKRIIRLSKEYEGRTGRRSGETG